MFRVLSTFSNHFINPPKAAFSAVGNPLAAQPLYYPGQMGFPQPVAPNIPNMPPDMLQAYQQKMMAIMSDPQKKALFLQLVQAAQAGKIQPMQLADQLDKLVAIGEPKPKGIGSAFIMASIFGLGVGQAVRTSLNQFEQSTTKPSVLENIMHTIDAIPGVAAVNRVIQNQLDIRIKRTENQPNERLSRLLKLDNYYETEQLKREMVQRHLGPNGMYQSELEALEKSLKGLIEPEKFESFIQRIRSVSRHSELMQLVKPKAIYFVPVSIRDYVRKHKDFKNVNAATLEELDQLICNNEFIKKIGRHPYGEKLLNDGSNLLSKLLTESKPQAFAKLYENTILKDPEYVKTLQKIWDGALPKNYASLRQSLELKPFWDHIYDNLKGLLFDGNKPVKAFFSPKSSLSYIDEQITKYHLVKHLDKLAPWHTFMEKTQGFLKRFGNFEKSHIPIIESIKAFSDQMKAKGIKPVGRIAGLLWFNFSRMFEGNHYQRLRLVSLINKQSAGYLNRLLIASMIFGFSVLLANKGRDESRRARFCDAIATGLGGYYGWELSRNILPQFEPLHNNFLGRLLNKRLIKWPWVLTIGGAFHFIMPFFITSWLFSTLSQKPIHWLFGDPDKIDQQLNKRDTEKMMEQLKASQSITPPSPANIRQSAPLPAFYPTYYANTNNPYNMTGNYLPYYNNYYAAPTMWPFMQQPYSLPPMPQPVALAPLSKEQPAQPASKKSDPKKSEIEPVSINKASQKIPKVTYTLDIKGSLDRLSRNPLEDDANREELRLMRQLGPIRI